MTRFGFKPERPREKPQHHLPPENELNPSFTGVILTEKQLADSLAELEPIYLTDRRRNRERMRTEVARARANCVEATEIYNVYGNVETMNQASSIYEEYIARALYHTLLAEDTSNLDHVVEAAACYSAAQSALDHFGCGFGATLSYARRAYNQVKTSEIVPSN